MMNKGIFIKEGLRESFKEGTSKLADRPCYGYMKSDDDTLVINEPEAQIVRWIFARYLAGDSLGKISDGLAKQGIPSPTGKEKWSRQAIDKLLSNEKYAGRVLLQKTVTQDGRQIRNAGLANRYLYHNNNPAIISEELFESVQAEKLSRSKKPDHKLTMSL